MVALHAASTAGSSDAIVIRCQSGSPSARCVARKLGASRPPPTRTICAPPSSVRTMVIGNAVMGCWAYCRAEYTDASMSFGNGRSV